MNVEIATFAPMFFALTMLAPIAPFAFWYRNRALRVLGEADRKRILVSLHPESRRVWISWAIVLLLAVTWFGFDFVSEQALSNVVPSVVVVLLLFHGQAWPFVLPLFNRLEQQIVKTVGAESTVPDSVRTASLTPRRFEDYLPRYWAWLIAVFALSGVFVAGIAIVQVGAMETRFPVMAGSFVCIGLLELGLFTMVIRTEVSSTATYGGLSQEAAESFRQFRVRGFFWMLIAMSVVFFGCALGCIEVGRGTIPEPNLGILGGVAGSILGLAGAAFGTAASLKANRLRAGGVQRNSTS